MRRLACLLVLLAACSGQGEPPDSPSTTDAGVDAGAPFERCEGDCRTSTLAFEKAGGASFALSQAAYGLTAPTGGAPWELYVEAWEGGFTGCPKQDSPTPERTLILAGLAVPHDASPQTHADGAVARLLDYEGDIFAADQLVSRASSVVVTAASSHACPAPGFACDAAEGFVALEVEATFAEGVAHGHVFAPHCDTLDD